MRVIRSLSRRACPRAIAFVLAWMVCLSVVHARWDDTACDPQPIHHDHSAHRFRAGTTTAPDDHCLLCHSLRTLRRGLVATATPVVATASTGRVHARPPVAASRLLDPIAPARAPPLL